MAYTVIRKKSFAKELADLPGDIRELAEKVIETIAENPRSSMHGMKQLKGQDAGHSARVRRDYRIIYDVDDAAQMVTLLTIEHRSSVYRR